jgi:hypothetical protein
MGKKVPQQARTVQQLIDMLMAIENKKINVRIAVLTDGGPSFTSTEKLYVEHNTDEDVVEVYAQGGEDEEGDCNRCGDF